MNLEEEREFLVKFMMVYLGIAGISADSQEALRIGEGLEMGLTLALLHPEYAHALLQAIQHVVHEGEEPLLAKVLVDLIVQGVPLSILQE